MRFTARCCCSRSGPIETRHSFPVDLACRIDRQDCPLRGRESYAVRFTWVRIVRVEFPALVDEIIVIHAGVADDIAILVSWIINARRAVFEVFVYIIQLLEGVFLSILPPFCCPAIAILVVVVVAIVVVFIVLSQLNIAVETKAIKCISSFLIWCQAVTIGVQSHLEFPVTLWSHSGIDALAFARLPNIKAVRIRHVR